LCVSGGRLNARGALGIPVMPSVLQIFVSPDKSGAQIRLLGEPGRGYVFEGSTNLTNWMPISTNNTPLDGTLVISDTTVTNLQKRYYRARLIQ